MNLLSLKLESNTKRIVRDESLKLKVYFKLSGLVRDLFNQKNWEEAWDKHDLTLRMDYHLKIYKNGLIKKLLSDLKFVRKAKFYWSRNPDLPYRIWVMIVDEDGNPILPKDEEEAKSVFFEGFKSFSFFGKEIGLGEHGLIANMKAKWSKHSFIDKGEIEANSNKVSIEVIEYKDYSLNRETILS
ncbi:MAG: hypothetical protein QXX95_03375 [Nitrososphaerales archaeon]